MDSFKFKAVLGVLRIGMGLMFLWAFIDKLWGLGFATAKESAWILGSSPTSGFLQFGAHGPFAEFFRSLAGSAMVDWLFMLGLLGVGLTLTLGICVKLGAYSGALILFLMYLAVGLPPEHHPFIDDHFIYFFLMLLLAWGNAGKYFGLSNRWYNTALVQKYRFLA